jgi:hypothetical protein
MKNTPNGARVTLVSSNYGVPVVKLGLVLLQGGCGLAQPTLYSKIKVITFGFTPHSLTATIASHQPTFSPIVPESDHIESKAAPTVQTAPCYDPRSDRWAHGAATEQWRSTTST